MPVFSTQLSGSILGQLTGSLRVKGDTHVTGSIYATQILSASSFQTKGIISGSQLKVGPTSITGSLFISQHSNRTNPPFEPEILLSKNDSTIMAGDPIGTIQFRGEDSTSAGTGASITTIAANNWLSGDKRPTNINFSTQNDTTGDSLIRPRLTISASGGVGAEIHIHTPVLQVGVGGDGDEADPASGIQARVSACATGNEGPAGLEIEAGGTTNTSSLTFARDNNTSERQGWFVDWAAADRDRVTYRWSGATDIGASPIAITDPANNTDGSGGWTVRIGGGGAFTASNAAWDARPSLLVTSSYFSRQSLITIRNMNTHNPSTGLAGHKDAVPGISWNYQQKVSAQNDGIWTMGIEPYNKSLTIGSPGGSLGTGYNRNTTAMVFLEAGDSTKVGIGGENSTWGPGTGNHARSLIPSATLHIENQSGSPYSNMDRTITQGSTLLLGNSINGAGEMTAQITFDVSTQSDIEYHSAHIAVVNAEDAHGSATAAGHTSFLSTGLYDGSGLKDSTRSRMRIDSQGGVIMLSGTMQGANAGWPRNGSGFYNIAQEDVPSGSLTLISLMDGTHGRDPATLNLVSWTGTNGNRGAITTGDSLGRVVWNSSDSQLDKEEQVAAFIETIASQTHNGSNLSPGSMHFYTRNTAEAVPGLTLELHADHDVAIPHGDLIVAGDISVQGNDIKDSGGSAAITFDGSQNTQLAGDLAVVGRDISSAGNTGTANIFTDTGSSFINIGGDGSTTSVKTLNVAANDITDSNSNIVISFDGAGNIDGLGQINQDVVIGGTSPMLTIGDGDNEVTSLVFNASPQDFHFGQKNGTAMIGGGVTVSAKQSLMVSGSGISWFGHGINRSPSIYVTDHGGKSTLANQWIKFADVPRSTGMYEREIQGLFLVNIQGYVGAQAGQNSTFLVESKVVPYNGGNGYYNDPAGTTLRVEVFDAGDDAGAGTSQGLQGFDPTTDIVMIANDYAGQGHGYELWIKSKLQGKECYVTHLGGTGTDQMPLSDTCRASYIVCDGKDWAAALPTPAGTKSGKVFGKWVSKVFDAVRVESALASFGALGRMVLSDNEIDVSAGSLLVDVAGDISLDAGGDQIVLQDAGSARFVFNLDTTPELDVNGAFTIDGTSTITIDAVGDLDLVSAADCRVVVGSSQQVYFQSDAIDFFTFNCDSTPQIDFYGNTYLNLTNGNNIYFQDSGVTAFQFDVDATPNMIMTGNSKIDSTGTLEIECTGNFTLDASADIELNADGGEIYFKDGTATRAYVNSTKIDSSGDVDANDDVWVRGIAYSSGHTDSQYVKIYYQGQGTNNWKLLRYTSTAKVKKNIVDMPNQPGLEHVIQLNPRMWDSKNGLETDCKGFIAEEVFEVHPDFAALGPDFAYDFEAGTTLRKRHVDPDTGKVTVENMFDSDELVPNNIIEMNIQIGLINSIKELKEQNDALVARIAALENS